MAGRAGVGFVVAALSALVAMIVAGASAAESRPAAAGMFEWVTVTPESEGLSTVRLDRLREGLASRSSALLIVHRDRIVYEWYAPGVSATTRLGTASTAKALVGGTATAVALSDHLVRLDDLAARYIPQWRDDPRKSQITLRQLGSHTAGLDDAEIGDLPHDKLAGWQREFWQARPPPHDPFTLSRDVTPMLFSPGQRFSYSNPGIAILTYALAAALQRAPEPDLRALLRDRVMRKIGLSDDAWRVGYGKTFMVDGLPRVAAWGGGDFTARDLARIGRLMLREGEWDGQQVLAREAVRAVIDNDELPGDVAIGWWTNSRRKIPEIPADAYYASGAGHKVVLVIPSRQLIVVRNGQQLGDPSERYADAQRRHFFAPLMEALGFGDERPAGVTAVPAPYPPSPVISGVRWAPASQIIRRAQGGDNWPLTWADDDALYTAYGDGNGFEPFEPKKLSLGLSKVLGNPPDFHGVNFTGEGVEAVGNGKAARKASGFLMVDGVLYLLARNLGNSQLAWSRDHGATWTWADWKFSPSFGCPTFLNFGRNYAGARDSFVYIYSLDGANAYDAADRMVLARVPKDRLASRADYRFFARLDSSGQPVWTEDIAQRGAVFSNPGRCFRGSVTFDAGLRRYLWCQILPASRHPQGPRFQGGFGIYDAPEPWGPWTTVYFNEDWDVGPGESSSVPTKWMSPDGRDAWLVFSGDDSFSVRALTFVLRGTPELLHPR